MLRGARVLGGAPRRGRHNAACASRRTPRIGARLNGDTVLISLSDRILPRRILGTGYAQVTLLAAIATERDSQVVCIEAELHRW